MPPLLDLKLQACDTNAGCVGGGGALQGKEGKPAQASPAGRGQRRAQAADLLRSLLETGQRMLPAFQSPARDGLPAILSFSTRCRLCVEQL